MTAVKHAFTELPTIDIRDLAGADRRRPRGGEADLRPADGGEDELLHRPLQKP